ncbi:MAG TPA: hypothetical protein VFV62_05870, partial [Gaiellaceae bacterium]|nr:hypothetical protein [Gaiellaceae bacterium]
MSVGHKSSAALPIEVAAGTGLSLLVTLAGAASKPVDDREPALRSALEAVGDGAGESWLNLFGVALDAGAPYSSDRLLDGLAALDGVELRKHLLGRYAWSWCSIAGIDAIEAAAAGDRGATRTLLRHPRYYAGQAEASLSVLLSLDADEAKRRILRAVGVGAERLVDERATGAIETAGVEAAAALRELLP